MEEQKCEKFRKDFIDLKQRMNYFDADLAKAIKKRKIYFTTFSRDRLLLRSAIYNLFQKVQKEKFILFVSKEMALVLYDEDNKDVVPKLDQVRNVMRIIQGRLFVGRGERVDLTFGEATKNLRLPENLEISGALNLNGSDIEVLPYGLTVGELTISTRIKKLPFDLQVKGHLIIGSLGDDDGNDLLSQAKTLKKVGRIGGNIYFDGEVV